MAIDVKEVGSVWVLKDMLFTSYDEGEDLISETSYGLFVSRESADRASLQLSESDSNLPRGIWVVADELIYE